MKAPLILWPLGLIFIGFGLLALLNPLILANVLHLNPVDALGTTELRAFYGGLEIGFGLFLLLGARKPEFSAACLMAGAMVLGFLAVARTFGMAIDGSVSKLYLVSLSSEIIGVLLCVWAMKADQRN